jgi:hypothetical protein
MTAEQVDAIEQNVNEKIRDRLPVSVRELSLDDPEVEQVSGQLESGFCRMSLQRSLSKFRQPFFVPSIPGEGPGFAR